MVVRTEGTDGGMQGRFVYVWNRGLDFRADIKDCNLKENNKVIFKNKLLWLLLEIKKKIFIIVEGKPLFLYKAPCCIINFIPSYDQDASLNEPKREKKMAKIYKNNPGIFWYNICWNIKTFKKIVSDVPAIYGRHR